MLQDKRGRSEAEMWFYYQRINHQMTHGVLLSPQVHSMFPSRPDAFAFLLVGVDGDQSDRF